jgi:conjugative transfer ATPase
MELLHKLGLGFLGASKAGRAASGHAAPGQPAPEPPPAQPPEQPRRGLTVGERRRMAMRPPSFTDLLPYVYYLADEQVFTFSDVASLGVMFELAPVPTEAQAMDYLLDRAHKVQEALQALPESQTSPWVVQFFLNDDRHIGGLNQQLREYIAQTHEKYPERQRQVLDSPFTQSVLEEFARHLERVSRPEGLFVDTQVTGQVWRGQQRRVRCCIYKRFGKLAEEPAPAQSQIEAVAATLMATMSEAGIQARRCSGRDLYEWLVPFFNPKPKWVKDSAELLRMAPYRGGTPSEIARNDCPGRDVAPIFGWDLANVLNFSQPFSDMDAGLWEFDGVPIKAMVLQNMHTQPQVGHFSSELPSGKDSFARFDRLPAGAMLSISIALEPQFKLEQHVEKIRDASRAQNANAMETHRECEQVLAHMATGDKLFPMMLTLYVTGPDRAALQASVSQTNALLQPTGLHFIDPAQDLVPLDEFMRSLPFNFDPAFDNKYLRRSRLTFASHLAALAPVYGRSRGTEHPGFCFWNRGGEPVWIDPLNKRDRKKNAHMIVFGPTGAGKSATLNYLAMMMMAIHRPRLVIVDAGCSFGLLMRYFAEMGLSTHSVTLNSEAEVSLPPFVHALRLLEDRDVMESYEAAEQQSRASAGLSDDEAFEALLGASGQPDADAAPGAEEAQEDSDGAGKRDLLGEMLTSSILMITGGEAAEVARMRRADRFLISRAIIRAALRARHDGKPHPLIHDVALALTDLRNDGTMSPSRQARAEDMGQAMMSFTQGLRGKLFNRPGQDWPDADVTLVEMGALTQSSYSDALGLAYTSLLDSVQSRGERFQAEDRPLIFLTDEGHLITTNELLGPRIATGTKMWRKLNIWFWMATQNIEDFPGSMSRVLSMCEYWMLLTLDHKEIQDVGRFRSLTPEQRRMIESARKEAPKYTEGVLITASGQLLFRNVPPPLPIALAMTEGHEKAQRKRLMDEHGCTEVQAAKMVAEELARSRS